MRDAIATGRIAFHYQPVIDMQTGDMASVEVLARWNDSVHGSIPAQANSSHWPRRARPRSSALGLHVLHVCGMPTGRRLARQAIVIAQVPFSIAVNVSARQLDDEAFFECVEGALHDGGLAASNLVLELTESAMLHPRPQLRTSLERLRRSGVRLSLDDFGAGYSSLSYLHRFPFDLLKIDRALVERVGYSSDGTALVRAVLSVAEALNLAVIAEGVEDTLQQDELLRIGCRLGQGFLLARPMPAPQFLEWLANRWLAAQLGVSKSFRPVSSSRSVVEHHHVFGLREEQPAFDQCAGQCGDCCEPQGPGSESRQQHRHQQGKQWKSGEQQQRDRAQFCGVLARQHEPHFARQVVRLGVRPLEGRDLAEPCKRGRSFA